MDAVAELIEIERIKRLKARYLRCLDTKDWDGFLGVFTDDATLTFDLAVSTLGRDGRSAPPMVGKAAIAAFVPRDLATAQTVHQGFTPEIDLLDETEAAGIWPMADIVDHGDRIYRGEGHYHETYRKTAQGWRISSVHLTRVRLSLEMRDVVAHP